MSISNFGIVVIGRNEGDRLRRCLDSAAGRAAAVAYVDSGSTDGSVGLARSLGASVVELDPSIPFTAARARNEGFARLLEQAPDVRYVQFVDGDCEIVEGWLERAVEFLETEPGFAVVCGRRRERFPDYSVYNRLADIEWDTPIGEAKACGGDALMRVDAFRAVGGFNRALIAGEEPDLCVRLRREGWKIFRLDAEMTLHDVAMNRFGQWWRRAERAGHAYAEGAALHGRSPEKYRIRETRSILAWGAALPVLCLLLAWPTRGVSLLLLLLYPLQAVRIAIRRWRNGLDRRSAAIYGSACMVGKFAQMVGLARYWIGQTLRRRPSALIEYK